MRLHKKKKIVRMRGQKTHGYGSKKKHRGAGSRGGHGMGGTGKRADSKKPSIWKEDYFGKRGFKRKNIQPVRGVNIEYLERKLPGAPGSVVEVDLGKLGYGKLLGKGTPTRVYKIKADYASANAIAKIKAKGGEVTLLTDFKAKPESIGSVQDDVTPVEESQEPAKLNPVSDKEVKQKVKPRKQSE